MLLDLILNNKRYSEVELSLSRIKSIGLLLPLFFTFFSCVKQTDLNELSISSNRCENFNGPNSNCNLEASQNLYLYSSEYGGRSPLITSPINVSDNILTYNLPTGWYQGVQIQYGSSNLIAGNANRIKQGTNLFGVSGTFVSAANPTCSPTGLQSSDCSAANGQFLFSSIYGGRGLNCANYDNGLSNSTCWVASTGYTIDTVPSNPALCSAEGQQGTVCSGAVNTYFYESEYGGRASICVNGYNSSPCWVSLVGKFLTNSANECTDNAYNNLTCGTQPGRYIYQDAFGGRSANCTNDLSGLCYVTNSSKVALEPNLTADKIRIGKTIFGITGTFSGTGDWYSGMHRDQDTAPITMSVESSVFAGSAGAGNLPGGYRMIPSILKDDEGVLSTEVMYVDRTGWGNTSCGTTQNTILARITHCDSVFGANAVWDGSIRGNAGHSRWKLVTRVGAVVSGKGREVWLDEKTGLLWSSLISRNLNWCKAVGSSNNSGVALRYRENDDQDICDQDVNQNNSSGLVVSACFEESGFSSSDVNIDNLGKGGMALAATVSSPAVAWRVPTIYDYELADFHGARFVLPDMGKYSSGEEWIATIVSNDHNMAWTYFSDFSVHGSKLRNQTASVRCIGR